MNKSYNFVAIGLTVVVVGIAAYFFIATPSVPTVVTPIDVTARAHYQCAAGSTIDAAYTTDSVTLTLSDGRVVTLPQGMSGSGIRYEKDTIAFLSKGDNAFLEENNIVTYENCIVNNAPETVVDGKKTFIDQGKTFRFSYQKDLVVSAGEMGYISSWQVNTQTLGIVLAKMVLPRETQPKTNFGEATFTVGTSSDPQAIKGCLTSQQNEVVSKKGIVSINGVSYTKFFYADAAAGNRYDTTSYHTLRNDQCYVVEYTIHYSNIDNYSPDQGIKAFDEKKVEHTLESLVQSFTFL